MQWIYFLVAMLVPAKALDNGLALTPPMGWLSWLGFGCDISEDLIKRTADRMASDGYKEAGYEYIIIDDCWPERNRDKDGKLVADKKRFKSGMKALVDYVHSKGLKFGIYEDIGNRTCQNYPGLKGHEKIDAETFASWGVDYIKVDDCHENSPTMLTDYAALGKTLNQTGRKMLYSCSYPSYFGGNVNYTQVAEHCNIWRNIGDIDKTWSSISSILDWFGDRPELAKFAGRGHFHDADMLVAGNGKITVKEAAIQMVAWSILATPLLMSTDLDTIKPEFKKILLNRSTIGISQDPLGQMGKRLHKFKNGTQVWARNVTGAVAVLVFTPNNDTQTYTFTKTDLNLHPAEDIIALDLFAPHLQTDWIGNTVFNVEINPMGLRLFKFSKHDNRRNGASLFEIFEDFSTGV